MTAIRYIARDLPATIEMDGRRLGPGARHRSGGSTGAVRRAVLLPAGQPSSARWAQSLRWLATRGQPDDQRNDRVGARQNVSRHYDLSNAMFAEFLDPTMTYSAAQFDEDPGSDLATVRYDDLLPAELRKLDALLDAAGVRAGSRVLDIGCGWASLAVRATQRGGWVRAITIASQQALRRLAAGGVAVVQAIVMPHDRMLATRNTFTWVQKYIFPGGCPRSTRSSR